MKTNWSKAVALTLPSLVGMCIMGYIYCCPGLARLPSFWNVLVERYLFLVCVLGGTITAIFGLIFLQRKWDDLDPALKTMAMVFNLGWLGCVLFIAVHLHGQA